MDGLLRLTSSPTERGAKNIEASQLIDAPIRDHFAMHPRKEGPDLKMAGQIDDLIGYHRVSLLVMQKVDLLGEHVVKELVALQILPPKIVGTPLD